MALFLLAVLKPRVQTQKLFISMAVIFANFFHLGTQMMLQTRFWCSYNALSALALWPTQIWITVA